MGSIDDLANDPDWQPALDKDAVRVFLVRAPYHTNEHHKHIAIIRELNNGLFYSRVFANNDGEVLRNTSYNVDEEPKLPNGYRAVNLVVSQDNGHQVSTTTFRYEFGKRKGLPTTWIDYTVWHNPRYGSKGLTKLKSLQAVQEVQGGRLDIMINAATHNFGDRSMKVNLSSSDRVDESLMEEPDEVLTHKLDGDLRFDSQGRLLRSYSNTRLISSGHLNHPLSSIYHDTFGGARIDALRTARALFNGFSSQIPLDIIQLIQYIPEYSQPRYSQPRLI